MTVTDREPGIVLHVEDALVATVSVDVRVLRIGKKQMTLAVFRQLADEYPVTLDEQAQLVWRGRLWGWVNYHTKECPNQAHRHVVWQKEGELRSAMVEKDLAGSELDQRLRQLWWDLNAGLRGLLWANLLAEHPRRSQGGTYRNFEFVVSGWGKYKAEYQVSPEERLLLEPLPAHMREDFRCLPHDEDYYREQQAKYQEQTEAARKVLRQQFQELVPEAKTVSGAELQRYRLNPILNQIFRVQNHCTLVWQEVLASEHLFIAV
jgi:hypothetical protein